MSENQTASIPNVPISDKPVQASKLPPTVIDESLLPPPKIIEFENRRDIGPLLGYEAWAWYQTIFNWIPGRLGWLIRRLAYKPFFQRAGIGWHIGEFSSIQRVNHFQIGHKCAIGRFSVINAIGGVILGDYSGMGPFVQLITATHNFRKQKDTDLPYGAQPRVLETAPIVIEPNTWIGASTIVLPGVRIGTNSVVAAGSVVHRDIPSYAMVAGVPAKVVWQKSKEEYEAGEGEFVLRSLVETIQKYKSQ